MSQTGFQDHYRFRWRARVVKRRRRWKAIYIISCNRLLARRRCAITTRIRLAGVIGWDTAGYERNSGSQIRSAVGGGGGGGISHVTCHYSPYFKASLPAPSLYDCGAVCLCCYRATRKTTCITDAKTFFTPLSRTHVCMCICIMHTRYARCVLSIWGRHVVLLRKTMYTYTMHNTTSVTAKKAPG